MYAGCVHWPLRLAPWIGILLGVLIALGGIAEAVISSQKKT